MSTDDVLRGTAALMRERAEAALSVGPDTCGFWYTAEALHDPDGRIPDLEDAEHIASWHPAVALAVADWLDREADKSEQVDAFDHAYGLEPDEAILSARARDMAPALAVADAYLGGAK